MSVSQWQFSFLWLAITLFCASHAEAQGMPPATAPATAPTKTQHFTLTGTLHSANPIVKIVAVDRLLADPLAISKPDSQDAFCYPGTFDTTTHQFSIPKLLTGSTYDLIVWTAPDPKTPPAQWQRWEGVNMDYHREITPADPVTEADKTWLKDFIATEPMFTNKNRVLWMAADHLHATLLVELIRDTDFHSGKSKEIIYRTELWYFENLHGGWAKDKNTEKVLVRWRTDAQNFPQVWQFVPALGGIQISAEGKISPHPTLDITLPKAPEAKHGVSTGLLVK